HAALNLLRRNRSGGGEGRADFLLDAQSQRRKVGIVLLEQEGIQTTAVLDGAQGGSGDAQLDRTVQRVRDQGDVHQIGEKTAAGAVEGVRNIVAHHNALAGQFAATCHWSRSCLCKGPAWRDR